MRSATRDPVVYPEDAAVRLQQFAELADFADAPDASELALLLRRERILAFQPGFAIHEKITAYDC